MTDLTPADIVVKFSVSKEYLGGPPAGSSHWSCAHSVLALARYARDMAVKAGEWPCSKCGHIQLVHEASKTCWAPSAAGLGPCDCLEYRALQLEAKDGQA